jgi:DNA-binding response OmpR family regulator
VLAGRELELSRKEFDLLAELVRHAAVSSRART